MPAVAQVSNAEAIIAALKLQIEKLRCEIYSQRSERKARLLDVLPRPFDLPADIRTGDWIEIGMLGAYSNAMRTRFNGFYPDTMVEIAGAGALPPGVAL